MVKQAHSSGFSYSQIWEKISGSGLSQSKAILSLDGWREMKLNTALTVPQNTLRYYERAKEMGRKARGSKEALDVTEDLKAGKAAPRKARL